MKLSPLEIRKQEFRKTFRGYDTNEVATFLDMVANEFEELQATIQTLSAKNAELETSLHNYKSVEQAIQQTLMQAQETSGRAIENARKEAQLLLHETELKASQMLDKARNDLTSLKEQFTILKAKKDSIVSRLKMLLNSELELIKALEVDEEMQTGSSTEHKDYTHQRAEIEEIIKSIE
jgi:cell division initiation protein